jgi:outer membrane protein assembly factor BamD (BamD/ComL family)
MRSATATPRAVPAIIGLGCALWLALASPASGQVQEFKLDGSDRWTETKEIDPVSDEGQIMAMRQALEAKDHGRARNLADRFIEARPLSPLRAEALLVRADATYGLDDEYNALYDYEEVCRRYAGSEVFVTALEREFEIAVAYAKGKKRKFFGTFRLLSAYEDAQELLIRIQERLPGSELAEKAGLALADFYFDNRELTLAAEAYDLFLENYPKSKHVTKAQLRLIYSYIAAFKGPLYDLTGLIEAKTRLRSLQVTDPALAEQVGADAILVRVYESEAAKLLTTADWYWKTGDAISAELFIRRIIKQYPHSVACLDALRVIPEVFAKLPESIARGAPNYRAMREAKLGVAWEVTPTATPQPAPGPSPEPAPAASQAPPTEAKGAAAP